MLCFDIDGNCIYIKKAADKSDRFSAAFYVNLKDPSTPLRSAQDDN